MQADPPFPCPAGDRDEVVPGGELATDLALRQFDQQRRQRLGEALVKGPFTALYPGGLVMDATYYDAASTVYYPFSLDAAKELFKKAGLEDTDGNGFLNFPAGTAGGADVQIVLMTNTDYGTDKTIA